MAIDKSNLRSTIFRHLDGLAIAPVAVALNKKGVLKYYVFDIIYLKGHSIKDFPLLKRKELLAAFFENYKL